MLRSYGQLCAAAHALDVVGDRWSLLLVRELLARGPLRWTDLREGVPTMAKNLLAERLRQLEQHGVLAREDDRFALTERGRALEPVLHALVAWGAPLLAAAPETDLVRSHWVPIAVEAAAANGVPVELVAHDEQASTLRIGDETVHGTAGEVLRTLAAAAP